MATLKIKKAIKEIGVNGGNISKAMRKAGYAPSTAARTDKLTNRKGFQELLEKELPDSLLLKVHKEGLTAMKKFQEIVDRDSKGAPVYGLVDVDDHPTRHKFLESGYKIRGKLKEIDDAAPNRVPTQTLIIIQTPDGTTQVGVQTKP